MTTEQRKRRKITKAAVEKNKEAKLRAAVLRYGRAWVRENTAKADKNLAQVDVMGLLKALKLKTYGLEHENADGSRGTIKLTLVEPEGLVVDWAKVKKRIGAANWKKIVKEVPDQGLVDQALKAGLFTADDLAACSETKKNAEYIRPTITGVL